MLSNSQSSASRGTQTPNHSIARGRNINSSNKPNVVITKSAISSASVESRLALQPVVTRPSAAQLSALPSTSASAAFAASSPSNTSGVGSSSIRSSGGGSGSGSGSGGGGSARGGREAQNSKDHNSVTIKRDTSVKDAAGAIFKVLSRASVSLVTALRLEDSNEALNQAIKSLAVARKYVQDNNARPQSDLLFNCLGGSEEPLDLTFLPFNRCNNDNVVDPNLFAFMVFKTVVRERLLPNDATDLNVSRTSDVVKMANAIVSIVLDRKQAVMKAGGKDAVFVAMAAVVQARKRLLKTKNMDVMLVPSFVTENTAVSLGRESKFIKFNVIVCEPHGPRCNFVPTVVSELEA